VFFQSPRNNKGPNPNQPASEEYAVEDKGPGDLLRRGVVDCPLKVHRLRVDASSHRRLRQNPGLQPIIEIPRQKTDAASGKEQDDQRLFQAAARFLYGPRFATGASCAAIRVATSDMSQTRSVTPAAIAGVTRRLL